MSVHVGVHGCVWAAWVHMHVRGPVSVWENASSTAAGTPPIKLNRRPILSTLRELLPRHISVV